MNKKIINIRAIAITFIVFGHSIILYSKQWGIYTTNVNAPILEIIKDIINSFQLELFFALSGFLFYRSVMKQERVLDFVKKKISRLIIPYYFIAFLWMDPIKFILSTPGFANFRDTISSCSHQLIFSSGSTGHLWFLPTLFFIFVFSFIYMTKIYKHNIGAILTLFFILISSHYIGFHIPGYFQLNNILRYAIFFFMGYLLYYINTCVELSKYKKILALSCIILSFCRIITVYIHIIYILFLIFCIYTFIPNKTNKYTQTISDNSFGIYLFHSPLIYITYTYFKDCSPFLVVFLNFFVFGGISLLLSIATRNSKFKFILGE